MQSMDTNVRNTPHRKTGTYEAADELTERPPDGEDGQEVLMTGRDELCRTYIYI